MRRRAGPGRVLGSVLERSLHEHARSVVAWGAGLGVLALVETALFPTVRDNPALARLDEHYPEALRSLFALNDLATGAGFLRAEVFSFVAPLLVVVFAVLWGSDIVAGEEHRGTIDLLLANPVSRARVVLEKWAALGAGVTAVTAGLGLGLAVGVPAFSLGVGAAALSATLVATALLGLLFGSLALALGAATGRRGVARGVSAVLAVTAYLASALAPLVGALGPLKAVSPWYHALGVDPLASGFLFWHLLVLVGLVLVVLGGALAGFDRRDLAV